MAFENRRSQRCQPLRHNRRLQIGTGNFVSEVQQDLGNTTHADAANSDEMDALQFGKHGKQLSAFSSQLSAFSFQLSALSYQLPATSGLSSRIRSTVIPRKSRTELSRLEAQSRKLTADS